MKVTTKPELRAEHTYKGIKTVLKGAELARLTEVFFKHMDSKSKSMPKDFDGRLFFSVARAYQSLYGSGVCSGKELRDLSTADARKWDLFYRYVVHMFGEMEKQRKAKGQIRKKNK